MCRVASDVSTMPVASAFVGLVSAIVAILSVVLGVIIKTTVALTRLRMEVHSVVKDLADHMVESKSDRAELRTMTHEQLKDMAASLSRVDRDVARLSGRRRDSGIA